MMYVNENYEISNDYEVSADEEDLQDSIEESAFQEHHSIDMGMGMGKAGMGMGKAAMDQPQLYQLN